MVRPLIQKFRNPVEENPSTDQQSDSTTQDKSSSKKRISFCKKKAPQTFFFDSHSNTQNNSQKFSATANDFTNWVIEARKESQSLDPAHENQLLMFGDPQYQDSINKIFEFLKTHFLYVTFENGQIQIDFSNNKTDRIVIRHNADEQTFAIQINDGKPLILNQLDFAGFNSLLYAFDFKNLESDDQVVLENMHSNKEQETKRQLQIPYKHLFSDKIYSEKQEHLIDAIESQTEFGRKGVIVDRKLVKTLPALEELQKNTVRFPDNKASGVLVQDFSGELCVYTEHHVIRKYIENQESIPVQIGQKVYEVRIDKADKDTGFAKLKFDEKDLEKLSKNYSGIPIAKASPQENDFVITLGYPGGFNGNLTLTSGSIGNINTQKSNISASTLTDRGHSGGGLFWYDPQTESFVLLGVLRGGGGTDYLQTNKVYSGTMTSSFSIIPNVIE